jgi:hypothetical protein
MGIRMVQNNHIFITFLWLVFEPRIYMKIIFLGRVFSKPLIYFKDFKTTIIEVDFEEYSSK